MIKLETPEPEKKKGALDKLPKLSRASQLMLMVGIFLILFIPLAVLYQQQPAKRAGLEHELSLLQKALAAPTTKTDAMEMELKHAETELEEIKSTFSDPDLSPEITDSLLDLAEANDIDLTRSKVSVSTSKIGDTEYQVLTFNIDLRGQVPKFQNFILDLDDSFPTCQVNSVIFTVAAEEGEEDTASLKLDVFCY